MTKKPLKSWKTLASESKARRKTKPTKEQIERLNRIFEDIERFNDPQFVEIVQTIFRRNS